MTYSVVALILFCVVALCWKAYLLGRKAEKDRCMILIGRALEQRYSGTLRWVENAIRTNRESLVDEVEWFGHDDKLVMERRNKKTVQYEPKTVTYEHL